MYNKKYYHQLRIHFSSEWDADTCRFVPHSAVLIKTDSKTNKFVESHNLFIMYQNPLDYRDRYQINTRTSNTLGFDTTEKNFRNLVQILQDIFERYPTDMAAFFSIQEYTNSIIKLAEFRIRRVSLLTYSTMLQYKRLEEIKK